MERGGSADTDKHQPPNSVAEKKSEIDGIGAYPIRMLFDQAPAAILTSLTVVLIAVAGRVRK